MTNEITPLPWVNHTCSACEGSGRRLRPSFRGAYTQEEWSELQYETDGEWAGEYFNPHSSMHEKCDVCNGRGSIRKREPPYTAEPFSEPYYLWLKEHKKTCTCERAIDENGNELNLNACEDSTERIQAWWMSDYEQKLVEHNDVKMPEFKRKMALWDDFVDRYAEHCRKWVDCNGEGDNWPFPAPKVWRRFGAYDRPRDRVNCICVRGERFALPSHLSEVSRPYEPRTPTSPKWLKWSWGKAGQPYNSGGTATAPDEETARERIGTFVFNRDTGRMLEIVDIIWEGRIVDPKDEKPRYWYQTKVVAYKRALTHNDHNHLACGPFAYEVDFDAVKAYYRGCFEEWEDERQRRADRELYWAESGTPYHERY